MAEDFFSDIVDSGTPSRSLQPRAADPHLEVVNKPPSAMLSSLREYMFNQPASAKARVQKSGDMLYTAANAATFGGLDELVGVPSGVKSALSGDGFKEGFDEGRNKAKGRSAATAERLPFYEQFAAELVGTVPKRTPVGAMASAIEGAVGKGKKTTGFIGKLKRGFRDLATQAGIGAAEGGIRGTLDNIEVGASITETAAQLGMGEALEGGGTGAAGHAVLGMLVPKLAKYGIGMGLLSNRTTAEQKVGTFLLDTGPDSGSGVTPESIRAEYPNMIANDQNLFQTGAGQVSGAEMTNRLADLVAQTEFPERDFVQNFDTYSDQYAQTMAHISQIMQETNDAIKKNFVDALGLPRETSAARGRNLSPQLRKYQNTYQSLTSTKPHTLGAREVQYRGIVDKLDASIAQDMGYAEVADMSSMEGEVYSTMINELRPKGQYAHTRGLHRVPHAQVDGVDLDLANTKLNSLIRAREALSQKYKVGQLEGGTAVKPVEARAAAIMMKNLDKEIAARSFGKSKDARANFAKWMRVKDAEEIGSQFYTNSLTEHPEFGTSMSEFMEVNKDDPDVINAFQEGYKRSMASDIDANPPYQVVRNLLGDVTNVKDLDDANVNSAGLTNLRLMLGDAEADRLIASFKDQSQLKVGNDKLEGYLAAKEYTPQAIEDIKRAQDDLLLATGVNPAMGATLFATSTLGALGRRIEAFGVDEAELILNLAGNTGRSGVRTTDAMLETLLTPDRVSMGLTSVTGADVPKGEEEDYRANAQAELAKFLSGVSSPSSP